MSSRLRKKRNQRAERNTMSAKSVAELLATAHMPHTYGVHTWQYGVYTKICILCMAIYLILPEEYEWAKANGHVKLD